jgi:tRNA (mo5U34)-methyltransferase
MSGQTIIDYQHLLTGLNTLGEQQAQALRARSKRAVNKRSVKPASLSQWAAQLPGDIARGLSPQRWGDLPQWQQCLDSLPSLAASSCDFSTGVRIGEADDCSDTQREQLRASLIALHPWRKGPYQLFGLDVDTEWRSDWKWDRLLPHIAPLKDKLVLDIGCGNGYHCWRMYGEGAQRVIGIDPSPRFVVQFYALKHYANQLAAQASAPQPTPEHTSLELGSSTQTAAGPHERGTSLPVDILPLGIEDLPPALEAFDTVFSMGVLYHRRSAIDHLLELKACLKPGGQLVLETLVIEGDEGQVLVPEGRYAKMRNVWFIPSPPTLLSWLRKCGFKAPRLVDVCDTSVNEQRATEWMHFESLPDFLDPNDSSRTCEGHPAPRRAVFIAEC